MSFFIKQALFGKGIDMQESKQEDTKLSLLCEMTAKSSNGANHLEDLHETLNTVRR